MTRKLQYHLSYIPQFVWSDDRIVTNFTDYEKKKGKVMNNNNIEKLWKPNLLIKNLSEFELHSVLEDVSGLSIGNGLVLGLNNETIVWYEFSANASIYCNFYFLGIQWTNKSTILQSELHTLPKELSFSPITLQYFALVRIHKVPMISI